MNVKHNEGQLSIKDIANACGRHYATVYAGVWCLGKIPKPDLTIGKRQYYSNAQALKAIAAIEGRKARGPGRPKK